MAKRPIKIEVKDMPLSQMKLRQENPRRISNENFARLKNSLKEFGQVINLVVNKDNVIISGNMRYRAMTELGWDTAGVVQIDTSLDDEQAINIILNSGRARGYFVIEKYQELVIENKELLQQLGIDEEYELDDIPVTDVDNSGVNFLSDDELEAQGEVNTDREDRVLVQVGDIAVRLDGEVYKQIAQQCDLKDQHPCKILVKALRANG